MKKKIQTALLVLLLLFNVFGVFLYAAEGFSANIAMEERQVTIIDKYTIGRKNSSR